MYQLPHHDLEYHYRYVYLAPDPLLRHAFESGVGATFANLARQLNDVGIVRLPNLFSAPQLKKMQLEFDALMCAKVPDNHDHIQYGGAANEEYLVAAPGLSEAISRPIFWALGAHCWGRDPRFSFCRGYRIEPTPPKQYRAFQPHDDGHDKELKVMLLLTDVERDGQCMLYWPKTHKIDRQIKSSGDTLIHRDVLATLGKPLSCCGPAGSAFIFNTKGIHSGQRNMSMRRDTVVFNITGGKRLYPVPRLAPEVAAEFDGYRRSILRVGTEKLLDEVEGELPVPLPLKDRNEFLELHGVQLREDSKNSWDYSRFFVGSRSESHTLPNQLPARTPPGEKIYRFERPAMLSPEERDCLQRALAEAIGEDVNRGIDLPLDPYSGTRDRLRDVALCGIRDLHLGASKRSELAQSLALPDVSPFPQGVDNYLDLTDKIRAFYNELAATFRESALPLLPNHILLADDLSWCIRTAQAVSLLRTPLALLLGSLDFVREQIRGSELTTLIARSEMLLSETLLTYSFFVYVAQVQPVGAVHDLGDVVSGR